MTEPAMTSVDLEDRAESGESKAYLAVIEALHDLLGSHCPAELLDDAADRICAALVELGQQQAVAGASGARLTELQQRANEGAAAARARRLTGDAHGSLAPAIPEQVAAFNPQPFRWWS